MHNFNLGPEEESFALEALSVISYKQASFFKEALRCSLVKSKQQLDRFDDLYLQYWSEISKSENSKQKDVLEKKPQQKEEQKAPSISVIKKWLHGNHQEEEIKISSYDQNEVFTEQDFSSFSNDELTDALKFTNLLVKKLSNKKGRRYINSKQQKLIDLRKIIRKNISKSDEIIHLNFKKKKIEKLKLVLICDVSRSMELYSKFLIQFMYGLNQSSTKIETFVFSTKIERISKSLRSSDFSTVLDGLKSSFNHWSGGTRIGSALLEFKEKFGDQLLGHKTKVIILSDGWDTDEPELVEEALSYIKRRSSKLIWINPLAGNPNFRPETACLKAAMPYLDIFQAANNMESLQRLVAHI